jgi:hypothetical protein
MAVASAPPAVCSHTLSIAEFNLIKRSQAETHVASLSRKNLSGQSFWCSDAFHQWLSGFNGRDLLFAVSDRETILVSDLIIDIMRLSAFFRARFKGMLIEAGKILRNASHGDTEEENGLSYQSFVALWLGVEVIME